MDKNEDGKNNLIEKAKKSSIKAIDRYREWLSGPGGNRPGGNNGSLMDLVVSDFKKGAENGPLPHSIFKDSEKDYVAPENTHRLQKAKDLRDIDCRGIYRQLATVMRDAPIEERAVLVRDMLNGVAYQNGKLAKKDYANPKISTNPQSFNALMGVMESLKDSQVGHLEATDDAYHEVLPKDAIPVQYSWEEAADIIVTAFTKFHPEMGAIAEKAFSEGWIYKNAGSETFSDTYCQNGVRNWKTSDNKPDILVKFDGSQQSLALMAHELAHAIPELLSGKEPDGNYIDVPTAISETFGHVAGTLAVNEAIESAPTPEHRIARIHESAHATYYYSTNTRLQDFEHGLYSAAAAQYYAPLSTKELASIALDGAIQNGYLEDDASPEEKEKFAMKELVSIASHPQFVTAPPYSSLNYPLAEMGAASFTEKLQQATPEEQKQLAEKWVEVMRDYPWDGELDYDRALAAVGIDTQPEALAKGVEARLERLHGRVEQEMTKLGNPKSRLTSFEDRLREQRKAAAEREGYGYNR